MNIELTGSATSHWTVQGPLGIKTHWRIRVIEESKNEFIHYETVNSPGRRPSWKLCFSQGVDENQTQVGELMAIPLGRIGRSALTFFGKAQAMRCPSVLAALNR